jgi:hypothetical protein
MVGGFGDELRLRLSHTGASQCEVSAGQLGKFEGRGPRSALWLCDGLFDVHFPRNFKLTESFTKQHHNVEIRNVFLARARAEEAKEDRDSGERRR